MRITYEDALYISFQETTVETKELAEGIATDFDSKGLLVGIEILDASERLGRQEDIFRQVILENVALAAS